MRLIDADALEAKLEEQRKLYIDMDMKGASDDCHRLSRYRQKHIVSKKL